MLPGSGQWVAEMGICPSQALRKTALRLLQLTQQPRVAQRRLHTSRFAQCMGIMRVCSQSGLPMLDPRQQAAGEQGTCNSSAHGHRTAQHVHPHSIHPRRAQKPGALQGLHFDSCGAMRFEAGVVRGAGSNAGHVGRCGAPFTPPSSLLPLSHYVESTV